MSKEKTEKLSDKLLYKRKNGYETLAAADLVKVDDFCEGYKKFLNVGKTEREAVSAAELMAKAAGYKPFKRGDSVKPGDGVYLINHGKAIAVARIGKNTLDSGAYITAAHVDAPRIDLKPYPLYEDGDMALMKTHYYGGIRKYQWVALPLELHGVIAKADGTVENVSIGSEPEDPVFAVTDLLPHLAKDQNTKPLGTAFTGESLNVLVGSTPYADEEGDKYKLTAMSILNERYAMTEADFLSSELSFVPAGEARDVGLDRSLIGAYGQDDRVCAYSALVAMLDQTEIPEHTSVCILVDKEEIGSEGISGMQSEWFDTFMDDLCQAQSVKLRACYENSVCLSADVSNAYDPNFPEVSDKRNNSQINQGAVVVKYTGSGGKGGANDASAELIAALRKVFDDAGALWQMGELGKVDQGGGGTVAKFMAKRNILTVDVGVPVLSMHAPFEITSKLDVFMMYKAMKAFYEAESL
ncbi:MAG: aminopeptidase [Clostridia bacterium]|nr:aminopeptidase [Clostridia bacterium]